MSGANSEVSYSRAPSCGRYNDFTNESSQTTHTDTATGQWENERGSPSIPAPWDHPGIGTYPAGTNPFSDDDIEWGTDASNIHYPSNPCLRCFEIAIFCLAALIFLVMTMLVAFDWMGIRHGDWLHSVTLWILVIPTMALPTVMLFYTRERLRVSRIGMYDLGSREEAGDQESALKAGICCQLV